VDIATETRQVPRLRRSRSEKVVAGVCGGLGKYLRIDPIWLRIGFVALALGGGSGVVLYIITWIAVPEETDDAGIVPPAEGTSAAGVIVGAFLLIVGTLALINHFVPGFDDVMWPIALIALGALLMARR
jgi:phage shock protein C